MGKRRTTPEPESPAKAEPSSAPPPAAASEDEASDAELIQEFVLEAQDHLAASEQALLVLEHEPEDLQATATVFRAFHTIKGVSALLGFKPIAEFAHRAESLLAGVRDRRLFFTRDCADASLTAIDLMRRMVEQASTCQSHATFVPPADYASVFERLASPELGKLAPAAAPAVLPGSAPHATAPLDALKPDPGIPDAATRVAIPPPVAAALAAPRPAPAPAEPLAPSAVSANDWVRVRTQRLDSLLDMVGELVIAQSMVSADGSITGGTSPTLTRKVGHTGKIVRELQTLSLSLRLIPLKATFQRMVRVVRDTAQRIGREVELVTHGEDTELDRKLVDALGDPLLHMIRNAVDHGIEPPEQRLLAGKSRNGTVTLSARSHNGNVVVELTDDGRGLARERILEKALSRGLIESAQGLSDEQIYNLIFLPGFSTNDAVTDVSGRGVGMDVVLRAVESLNGRINIASRAGLGTTFSIIVPLTLAITDGMLVRVGSERYIIPTINILTSLRPSPDQLSTVGGQGELLLMRGEAVPLFRIDRLFGIAGARQDPAHALVVIVGDAQSRAALLVDELLGKQQVVTKSLGDGIGKVPGISGGAILGDGRVGLILDPSGLLALARRGAPSPPQPAPELLH